MLVSIHFNSNLAPSLGGLKQKKSHRDWGMILVFVCFIRISLGTKFRLKWRLKLALKNLHALLANVLENICVRSRVPWDDPEINKHQWFRDPRTPGSSCIKETDEPTLCRIHRLGPFDPRTRKCAKSPASSAGVLGHVVASWYIISIALPSGGKRSWVTGTVAWARLRTSRGFYILKQLLQSDLRWVSRKCKTFRRQCKKITHKSWKEARVCAAG